MAKYMVHVAIHAWQEMEIEADSMEEAEEAAREKADLFECDDEFEVDIVDCWNADEDEDEEEEDW